MDHDEDKTPTERTILTAPKMTVSKDEFVATLPEIIEDTKIMGLAYGELENIARAHDPILADKAAEIVGACQALVEYAAGRSENRIDPNRETIFGKLGK